MNDFSAIELGQRITSLLTLGRKQTTYKFALVMALMDYCVENLPKDPHDPLSVPIEDLADFVISYYWPQVDSYNVTIGPLYHGSGVSRNATIPNSIRAFKTKYADMRSAAFARETTSEYPSLRRKIAHELTRNPIKYLQTNGRNGSIEQFVLYDLPSDASNTTICLKNGVAWSLAYLEPLLRPFIENCWRDEIIRFNKGLKEDRLVEFLFGSSRSNIAKLTPNLSEFQNGKCFYCGKSFRPKEIEIDHVLPWSRTFIDGVANLVATDKRCNGNKSDMLPSYDLFKLAVERSVDEISSIAKHHNMATMFNETKATGEGLYKILPFGSPLWSGFDKFVWHTN